MCRIGKDSSAEGHAVTTGAEPQSNDVADASPAVRFSSAVDVAPDPPAVTRSIGDSHDDIFDEVTADQLKAFTKSLHGKPLQTHRMNTYQFEAFSLPASRVSQPPWSSCKPRGGMVTRPAIGCETPLAQESW